MDALSPQFQHCEQEKQDGAENLSNAPDQNEIIEIPAPPQAAKAQPYTKKIRQNLGISYCAETPRKQNGRASCREGVCKYVSNSGVAVSYKKKRENDKQKK